jgi:tetratricopeptide (TPR) repeat protein
MKRTQVKNTTDEVHREFESGGSQKALDTYQLTHKKYPEDSEILKSYTETIESMKVQGDEAFDKKDFFQAQIIYDLLLKNFPRFSNFANLLSFKKDFLVTRLKMSRILPAKKQAQSCLKNGDVQKGIDIYSGLIREYPKDTTVRDGYVSLLESIKARADLDFKGKDFVDAGRSYRILLRNYSSVRSLKRFLSYNAGLLNTRIETCRKILFEDALRQYRSGNLSLAISIWKNILTFDPENQEVKKAMDKAILQTGNLEKIKAGDTK